MRTLFSVLICVCLCALPIGCSRKADGNAKESGGKKQAKGSGDVRADLGKIWGKMDDWYRKTGQVAPPDEIPDGLAEVYNYQMCSTDRGSKFIVVYESKATNGKRYALYQNGMIEHVTDNELSALGVDPDPLTANERQEKLNKKSQKEMDDFIKKSNAISAQDETESDEKAKREREQTDREADKAREEIEKKLKDFEVKQKKEREQQDKEIEQQRQEIEKKRKDVEEKQKKAGENNPKGTTSAPTKPGIDEKETPPNIQLAIRTSWRTKVSLRSPYPQSSAGAPTDKISVQYAAMEILRQAGIEYDFNKSQANVGELARQWITPNIVEAPCDRALSDLLGSVGLTYELANGKVVLRRK